MCNHLLVKHTFTTSMLRTLQQSQLQSRGHFILQQPQQLSQRLSNLNQSQERGECTPLEQKMATGFEANMFLFADCSLQNRQHQIWQIQQTLCTILTADCRQPDCNGMFCTVWYFDNGESHWHHCTGSNNNGFNYTHLLAVTPASD